MEDLTLLEFFKRKYNGTLLMPTTEEISIFNEMPSRKKFGFGAYSNIKSFEKIYNKFIKGKVYIPADRSPFHRPRGCPVFGFIIDRDGEIDMVRVKVETITEYLKEQVV